MSETVIALIAAVAKNGVIGARGGLPWRLSSDLKHFKAVTMGKPLVMGRKTFEAIGRPLPGRTTIVVTRDSNFASAGVAIAHDVGAALRLAAAFGSGEIVIAGGGEIYRETIGRAARLLITEVDLAPQGDARFPAIDPALWREVSREAGVRGPNDEAEFSFVAYERIGR